MIKKNDVITAEIVDYSSDGNGVAKIQRYSYICSVFCSG